MQDRARRGSGRRLVRDALNAAGSASSGAIAPFATPRRLTLVARRPAASSRPIVSDRAQRAAGRRAGAGASHGFCARPAALDTSSRSATPARREFCSPSSRKPGEAGGGAAAGAAAEAASASCPGRNRCAGAAATCAGCGRCSRYLCLFDGEVVPCRFELAPSAAGRHHARPSLHGAGARSRSRASPTTWPSCATAKVILDRCGAPSHRSPPRCESSRQAQGLALADDPGLLDEVTGLVEWPVPLLGGIDARVHGPAARGAGRPRCAPTRIFGRCATRTARWRRRFVLVANNEAQRRRQAIVAGNERVLRARLADAQFFWDQDRKVALESAPAGAGPSMRVPRQARHPGPSACERLVALAGARRRTCPAPTATRPSAPRCWPRPICHRHGRRVPGAAGRHGRLLCAREGEPAAVAEAIARPLRAEGPRRCLPDARPAAWSWRWPTSSTR